MKSAIEFTSPAPSYNTNVQEAISSARHELNQLLRQRAEIMKQIGTVKQTLVLLARMFGDDVLTPEVQRLLGCRGAASKQPGFTHACRIILMETGIPLEAWDGLRQLEHRFPELVERLKTPLASVTTVFNRLIGLAEVRSFHNGRGRRVWEWISEHRTVTEARLLLLLDDRLTMPTSSTTKQ